MRQFTVIAFLGLLISSVGFCEVSKEITDTITLSFKTSLPSLTIDQINSTPIDGIYEIVSGPVIMYATEDAKFAISGDILDLKDGETNITEISRKNARLSSLDKIGEKNMIVFKANKQRHVVTVFTDLDCVYCRKFHANMKEMNRKGITIRYLAFPRSGSKSSSFDKAVGVWCSKDKNKAMNEAKQGKPALRITCDDHKVDEQFHLGVMSGISGTPSVILQDGTLVPGYYDPSALLQMIKQTKQKKLKPTS